MLRATLITIIIISILNFSCNNTSKNIPNNNDDSLGIDKSTKIIDKKNLLDTNKADFLTKSNIPEFKTVAEQFIEYFNSKDTNALNAYIYPDYGITVLDNPGVYITVSTFTDFNPGNTYKGIFGNNYLNKMIIDCNLQSGKIPFYDCDDNGWNKEGCYYTDSANLDLVRLYDAIVEYVLYEEDTKYRNQLKDIENKLTNGVYSTKSFIGFYFGYFNDKWYLLAIDMIAPCSA